MDTSLMRTSFYYGWFGLVAFVSALITANLSNAASADQTPRCCRWSIYRGLTVAVCVGFDGSTVQSVLVTPCIYDVLCVTGFDTVLAWHTDVSYLYLRKNQRLGYTKKKAFDDVDGQVTNTL